MVMICKGTSPTPCETISGHRSVSNVCVDLFWNGSEGGDVGDRCQSVGSLTNLVPVCSHLGSSSRCRSLSMACKDSPHPLGGHHRTPEQRQRGPSSAHTCCWPGSFSRRGDHDQGACARPLQLRGALSASIVQGRQFQARLPKWSFLLSGWVTCEIEASAARH